MRIVVLVLTALPLLVACNARSKLTTSEASSSAQTTAAVAPAPAQSAGSPASSAVTIPVDGMSCGACAARLKRGLKNVDGVVDVEVSLEPGSARVRYVPAKTNPERLVAVIKAMEFTPGTPSEASSAK